MTALYFPALFMEMPRDIYCNHDGTRGHSEQEHPKPDIRPHVMTPDGMTEVNS